jgi:DNA-binding LytR/AlgR family response regulator
VIRVRVAPYEAPLEPVLREYLFAITATGALVMCALYFGLGSSASPQLRTGGYLLAASLFGIAQLAAEASRAVIAYEYPAQVVRVSLVLAFAVAFSFALMGYVAKRFRPNWLTPLLLVQGTSTAAAILLARGFDQKTASVIMSAAVLSAAISLDAMRRGIRSGAPIFAAFAACVALAALAPQTFLDRDLYLWMVVLFGGLAAEQARRRPMAGEAAAADAGAQAVPAERCTGLTLGSGSSRHFVMPGDIIRLASADDYTEVFLVGGRSLLHPEPLDRLVKRLSGPFVRVHRSHAINIAHLRTFTSGQNSLVVLSDDSTAPVSRRRLQAVKAAVGA